MPKQIQSTEQFEKLLPKALELRVVRDIDSVKLKLRTSDYLYTYKTSSDEAAGLIKSAKDIEVIEYSPQQEKKESDKEAESAKKNESDKSTVESKSQKKKKKSSQ